MRLQLYTSWAEGSNHQDREETFFFMWLSCVKDYILRTSFSFIPQSYTDTRVCVLACLSVFIKYVFYEYRKKNIIFQPYISLLVFIFCFVKNRWSVDRSMMTRVIFLYYNLTWVRVNINIISKPIFPRKTFLVRKEKLI